MTFRRVFHGFAIGVATALLSTAAGAAFAQGMGTATGHILDDKAKPVVGAMVTLTSADPSAKPVVLLSDLRGEWSIGVPPGDWMVEAVKSNLGGKTKVPVTIAAGATVDTGELKLAVLPVKPAPAAAPARGSGRGGGKPAPPDAEALRAAKRAELDAKFKSADDLLAAAKFDEAIADIMSVSVEVTSCDSCFSRLGDIYLAKATADTVDADKQADTAMGEKYYKQAIEMNPNSPAPYSALAALYNQMHRLDEAGQMSAKANELAAASGAGGNADALYNQGVILWNQQKAEEAQAALEKAVAADPKMADAQYLLGMVYVNQGKLAEAKKPLAEYLKLDPKGKHATDVKALLDAIK